MAQLDQCALLGSNDLEFFALQDAWEMTDSHYDTLKMVLMIDRGGKDPCVSLLRDPLCPAPLLAGFQLCRQWCIPVDIYTCSYLGMRCCSPGWICRQNSRGPVVNLPDFGNGKELVVEHGFLRDTGSIPEGEEPDMSEQATLSDFIGRAIRQFPADHYGIILWDHGACLFVWLYAFVGFRSITFRQV